MAQSILEYYASPIYFQLVVAQQSSVLEGLKKANTG